jgi:hypothetical protein
MGPDFEGPKVFHTVFFNPDKSLSYSNNEPTLPLYAAMYNARSLAMKNLALRCETNYNTVVLPDGDNWSVYALAVSSRPGVRVIGGHNKITVDHTGSHILDARAFSKSCLMMPPPPGNSNPPAATTHLVDPTPVETHVYFSLFYREPLYVTTDIGNWLVENGHISRIKSKKDHPNGIITPTFNRGSHP